MLADNIGAYEKIGARTPTLLAHAASHAAGTSHSGASTITSRGSGTATSSRPSARRSPPAAAAARAGAAPAAASPPPSARTASRACPRPWACAASSTRRSRSRSTRGRGRGGPPAARRRGDPLVPVTAVAFGESSSMSMSASSSSASASSGISSIPSMGESLSDLRRLPLFVEVGWVEAILEWTADFGSNEPNGSRSEAPREAPCESMRRLGTPRSLSTASKLNISAGAVVPPFFDASAATRILEQNDLLVQMRLPFPGSSRQTAVGVSVGNNAARALCPVCLSIVGCDAANAPP